MPADIQSFSAPLGFFSPDQVSPDTERPGLLRGATLDDPEDPRSLEFHRCDLFDWSTAPEPVLHLDKLGFDRIDLSARADLQAVLGKVRAAGEISQDDARQLRRGLRGSVFRLSSGRCLRLLVIAAEGLIMRKAGPNGLDPDPDVEMGEMNGHPAARAIHGDQDVRGTPLRQMMRGLAPLMFRHKTPGGGNRWSPLMLVNLWIPLDQVTRPLTLMDRRTLDQGRHQLRYALPTDAFLDRSEDMVVNDIWTFLHDDSQRWYFHSDMNARQAYVFDTLGTPHGSAILPGEDVAEQYVVTLRSVSDLLRQDQTAQAIHLAAGCSLELPADSTPALAQVIGAMQSLLREVSDGFPAQENQREAWLTRAQELTDKLIRKSLEMRVVALQLPDCWPFNREAR